MGRRQGARIAPIAALFCSHPEPAASNPRMDDVLLGFLERLAKLGEDNDARELARSKRMLNITRDTGRLLWTLGRAMGAARILEVGTSNGYSTIWLADAVRPSGGRITTIERDPKKVALARMNLETAGVD